MENYVDSAEAFRNSPADPELRSRALQVITGDQHDSSIIWASSYMLDTCGAEATLDKPIMDALDRVLAHGLTYERSPEEFLVTSRIMAQLCFKYQDYRRASNWLLFLRDLPPTSGSSLPAWVYLYSAKLLFVLEPNSAFSRPGGFFRYISEALDRLGPQGDSQCHGAVREFMDAAVDRAESEASYVACLPGILGALDAMNTQYASVFSEEYQDTLSRSIASGVLEKAVPSLLKAPDPAALVQFLTEVLAHARTRMEQDDLTAVVAKPVETVDQTVTLPRIPMPSARPPRILVLAGSVVNADDLYKAARQCGIADAHHQLELRLDYRKNKHFKLDELRYHSQYDGILIGPEAHKVCDVGDYSSLLQKLAIEEGFPPNTAIRTKAGTLRVTATGFKDAMSNLLAKIASNNPGT